MTAEMAAEMAKEMAAEMTTSSSPIMIAAKLRVSGQICVRSIMGSSGGSRAWLAPATRKSGTKSWAAMAPATTPASAP